MTNAGGRTSDVGELAATLRRALAEEPRFFGELVRLVPEGAWRDLLRAWGVVRSEGALERDDEGRYFIRAGGERRS